MVGSKKTVQRFSQILEACIDKIGTHRIYRIHLQFKLVKVSISYVASTSSGLKIPHPCGHIDVIFSHVQAELFQHVQRSNK